MPWSHEGQTARIALPPTQTYIYVHINILQQDFSWNWNSSMPVCTIYHRTKVPDIAKSPSRRKTSLLLTMSTATVKHIFVCFGVLLYAEETNKWDEIFTSNDHLTFPLRALCGPSACNNKRVIGEPRHKGHLFGFAIMCEAQNAQQLKIRGRRIKTQGTEHFRPCHEG